MFAQNAVHESHSVQDDIQSRYDVVIVGARCAGATLACFLAREGLSVLLLDRAKLPSDQVLSTHTIHPPGIDILDEVGVGDAIREVAPRARRLRLQKNNAVLDLDYPEDREEYCPRRERLDGLLQDAAVAAGAHLLDRTRVVSLVNDGDRVSGVIAARNGRQVQYRSSLVVGADGRHSTVARLVSAREYLAYDAPRAMYWGYWDPPPLWKSHPDYDFDMYVGRVGDGIRVVFQTDHGHLLIGSLPPVDRVSSWQADSEGALRADLLANPVTSPLIEGSNLHGKVRGTVRERYFFRESAGRGWVLVGDAGHHKEFVIGDGITEALLQAKTLTRAILEGSDRALIHWWHARDVEALPYYFFGQDEGSLGPPRELQSIVFTRIARIPELKARIIQVLDHRLSPYDVFPVSWVFKSMIGGALRGNKQVVREFFQLGRKGLLVRKEVQKRRKLMTTS